MYTVCGLSGPHKGRSSQTDPLDINEGITKTITTNANNQVPQGRMRYYVRELGGRPLRDESRLGEHSSLLGDLLIADLQLQGQLVLRRVLYKES